MKEQLPTPLPQIRSQLLSGKAGGSLQKGFITEELTIIITQGSQHQEGTQDIQPTKVVFFMSFHLLMQHWGSHGATGHPK